MKCFIFAILLLLHPLLALGSTTPHLGYISDVGQERQNSFYEVLLNVNLAKEKVSLREAIWNPTLSKEFKVQYRERFGQIDTSSGDQQTTETENQKRKDFAEYMIKRLSEFHVDDYFKNEPNVRPIYEAKEKLSNIQVQVSEQTRLQMKYSLAGNVIDFVIHNPYCESRVSLEMDSHSFGPTSPQETRLWLGKQITSSLRIQSQTTQQDGISALELARTFRSWTQTIGFSSPFKAEGTSPRENRFALGFGHVF